MPQTNFSCKSRKCKQTLILFLFLEISWGHYLSIREPNLYGFNFMLEFKIERKHSLHGNITSMPYIYIYIYIYIYTHIHTVRSIHIGTQFVLALYTTTMDLKLNKMCFNCRFSALIWGYLHPNQVNGVGITTVSICASHFLRDQR